MNFFIGAHILRYNGRMSNKAKNLRGAGAVIKILQLLRREYPQAKTALNFKTPLQMLVSTILSAQCTDVRVNKVTPALFKRYKTASDFATAPRKELEGLIHSTGFYRNKAKNIQGAARVMLEKFHGEVPSTMAEILELPGVARKTANVVLHNSYGKIEGVTVDTHVGRLSRRLGLTRQKNAVKVEQDLMRVVPRDSWAEISYLLIDHGRAVCKSQKPQCGKCVLRRDCPSVDAFDTPPGPGTRGKWIGPK